ncbi:protein-tyrosine phosphatase-like protein, partial [Cantharellus anzutake]|uniref:protein-tyrosine phosphatase-like protein n=1 Tax=Cantharellus anzutake TaxID=1750568 RepID=UPI001908D322
ITSAIPTRRRPSVMSLPAGSSSNLRRREIEDDGEGNPYEDGPIEILPGIWLGAEENAVAWDVLSGNKIGAILNVAKEVMLPLDTETPSRTDGNVKYFNADPSCGRPEIAYLHLMWSHGQSDLVKDGFPEGLGFVDQSLSRGTGVLIHCQCGISRSATVAIAYVMRAAYAPDAPPHLVALKRDGVQGSYQFVKAKSSLVGPNMSLMYELLEYQRSLESPSTESPQQSGEEEWLKKRQAMDEEEDVESQSNSPSLQMGIERAEAQELDQRMIIRRNQSRTSLASTT